MSRNPFQHVDIRVNNRREAEAFYAKLLPAIGFTVDEGGRNFHCYSDGGAAPDVAWFGFTEEADHRPNRNRIAFRAADRDEVDRAGEVVRDAGGRNISGPRECPEYSPTYYAVFFEDPSGNCLEVCYLAD